MNQFPSLNNLTMNQINNMMMPKSNIYNNIDLFMNQFSFSQSLLLLTNEFKTYQKDIELINLGYNLGLEDENNYFK